MIKIIKTYQNAVQALIPTYRAKSSRFSELKRHQRTIPSSDNRRYPARKNKIETTVKTQLHYQFRFLTVPTKSSELFLSMLFLCKFYAKTIK